VAFPLDGGKSNDPVIIHYRDFRRQVFCKMVLGAMQDFRTSNSPECDHQDFIPHFCGHRNCPHCQQHESQQWLERQLKKQVPAEYFLLTFTLPKEFRALAWHHQKTLYTLMMRCSWEIVQTFSQNDTKLQGKAGDTSIITRMCIG